MMYMDSKGILEVGMKRNIVGYIILCDTCHRVKAKHKMSVGYYDLKVLEWKWDGICMGIIVGLAHTQRDYDSILVVIFI